MSSTFLGEGEFTDTLPEVVPEGIMSPCIPTAGSQEVFKVNRDDNWAAFHFVGAMALKIVTVSIDEHPMWIYAVDGQYIKPKLAHTFIMRNGERYSAMIKLDQTPGDYTIRVANSLPNHVISGFATISYFRGIKKNGSTPYIDYGGNNLTSSVIQLDDTKISPFNVPPPSATVSATHVLTLARLGRNWRWTLNNQTSYELHLENHQNLLTNPYTAAALGNGLVINTEYGTWVDIVFVVDISPSNPAQPPHAMHKHSNRMYFIGKGRGPFVWPTVAIAKRAVPENFFLEDAPYRDTVTTDTTIKVPSWIVMRYYVGNPGPFILHCHMVTHLSGGMAVILMDGFDKWPRIPSEYDYKRIVFNATAP
jgi:FtsP/CotA-like multicopper oxidase with cupredoxin domain